MDTVSPAIRSRVMAQVRSRHNRSTEWRVRALLVRSGFRDWQVNPEDVPGAPDFVFRSKRVAIFTDGCFWHGCPRCKKVPSSNTAYWSGKIGRNRKRDRTTTAALRRQGWTVLRFWEHELSVLENVQRRIERAIHAHDPSTK